jgi:tetratricopeptide (TPR) repeat protein
MASDPDTSLQPDQPEQSGDAQADRRVVNTQGGDYAEGNIDKRQIIYQAPRESPSAFQVPYRPIPLVGRDDALTELAILLMGDAPVAVSPAVVGMGGVGKTMLAATFAHQNQAAFPGGVFWLNMEQPDLIAGQVAACAGPGGLDLPDYSALSFEDRIAHVRAAWNSPVRRLLVLDNLEDPVLLTHWQPTGSGTQVLITTRRDDWSRQVKRLRLPVLLRPQSVELLLGALADDQGRPLEALLTDKTERAAADAICDLLGDLPLALAIAAALLRLNPSLRLRDFQAQIMADLLFTTPADSTTMQAVLHEAGLPTRYERGVGASFALSYGHLQAADALDAQALRIIHAAAYCAPTLIPQEALWQAVDLDPASAAGRSAGDAAILRLRRLGLVSAVIVESVGAVTLHRLLATFVRQQPHAPEVLGATATALANHTRALQDAGQIRRSQDLVPHLEAVLAHQSETQGDAHLDTLRTANNLASALLEQGDYVAARTRFEAVLDAQSRQLGPEHPDTLRTAMGLASTLEFQGDYTSARARFEAVLEAQTRQLGPEHPDTLRTANNLAITLESQGDYTGAQVCFEAVLEACIRQLGPEHPDTLRTAMGLANTLYFQGDYTGARARFEAVLVAYIRLLGPEHPHTLATSNNLAITLYFQGDYAEARVRFEAVLAAYIRLLGPQHPHTLNTTNNLAETLLAQGDYVEARVRFEAVLEAQTHLLGPEHPHTLQTATTWPAR